MDEIWQIIFSTREIFEGYIARVELVSYLKELSPGKAGGIAIAAPSKGAAIGLKSKSKSETATSRHTPGTVKLWESPTRGGGLPTGNYLWQTPQLFLWGIGIASVVVATRGTSKR